MTTVRTVARAGAVAFALGLSLTGPHSAAVASADSATDQSATPCRGPAARDTAAPPPHRGGGAQEGAVRGTSPGILGAASAGSPGRRTPRAESPIATTLYTAPAASAPVGDLPVPTTSDATGRDPGIPADTPLGWTMLAAARRETVTAAAVAAASAPGTVIPQTPLFTALKLQEIPVIGPLLVTPVVTLVNHLPVIGDLLHPIFGYPLLPAGQVAPRDVKVVSFDGTEIYTHFLPANGLLVGQSAPTVLVGAAIGQPGGTNLDGTPLDPVFASSSGAISLAAPRNAGYNVVTWDTRGAYFSGGRLEIDSPDFEARDASAIIDWVAQLPQTQLDGPCDPRIGMAGASYGGGVQLVTAATDHRVDAIVPTIDWNTLTNSFYPSAAFKSGSTLMLAATLVVTLTRLNPSLLPAIIHGAITGELTPAGQDLLASRGPGPALGYPDLVGRISAPTMLVQGAVDAAFSLQEADITANSLLAQSVPLKMLWFCGGHGTCINNLFDFSQGPLIEQRTIAWLDHYVKGEAVSTGPAFEWVDQRGQHLSTDSYPAPAGNPITVSRDGHAVLPLIPYMFGSGPMFFVMPTGGTKALNAVNLDSPVSPTTSYIVGPPRLSFSYSGTGTGDHVYAQLVDNTTGLVLGNQVTPIPVTLDGATHTVDVALLPVAHTLSPGKTVTLQLFSWSADYAAKPSLGSMTVSDMATSLPTTPDPTVG